MLLILLSHKIYIGMYKFGAQKVKKQCKLRQDVYLYRQTTFPWSKHTVTMYHLNNIPIILFLSIEIKHHSLSFT